VATQQLLAGSQTLDRALAVLLEVGASGERGLSLAECTSLLGYSKPTTHRILRTLARRGFLRSDERGFYTLGIANLRLGMDFLEQLDLRREALPVLRRLADRTAETVHLGVLDGADVVYIEKVESPQAVRMFSRIGHTMPACSTGVGKAILAYLPQPELEELLPERLERRTPRTITSRRELLRNLAAVRDRGYATDDVENEEAIRCVGAPVFDHTGRVCAAISVAGPSSRVTAGRFPELGGLARDAAREISTRIGWSFDGGGARTK
jgi:IclR family acetate operon transcriptional repressor